MIWEGFLAGALAREGNPLVTPKADSDSRHKNPGGFISVADKLRPVGPLRFASLRKPFLTPIPVVPDVCRPARSLIAHRVTGRRRGARARAARTSHKATSDDGPAPPRPVTGSEVRP